MNSSIKGGLPENAPLDKEHFKHEIWVGVWRILFYIGISSLSILCGILTKDTFNAENLLISIKLSFLFIPFIFVYSLLFEITYAKFYPYYTKNKWWISGTYSRVYLIIIILSSTLLYAIWSTQSTLLPNYILVIPIILPTSLSVFLYTNRYRFLQKDRIKNWPSLEKRETKTPLSKGPFWIPTIALIFFAQLFIIDFTTLTKNEESKYLYFVLMTLFVIYLTFAGLGSYLGKKRKWEDEFEFERPYIREIFVIFATIVLPFITGIIHSYYKLERLNIIDEFKYLFNTIPNETNITILIILCLIGYVFELLRYLGKYNNSHFGRSLTGEDLSVRFKQSVKNYLSVVVSILSIVPILSFIAGYNIVLIIIVFIIVLLGIITSLLVIHEYEVMYNSQNYKISLKRIKERNIILIAIKIIGYFSFLLSFIIGTIYWKLKYAPPGPHFGETVQYIPVLLLLSLFVTFLFNKTIRSNRNKLLFPSFITGISIQNIIVITLTCFFMYYFYNEGLKENNIEEFKQWTMIDHWNLLAYWITFKGYLVYLGILYFVLSLGMMIIASTNIVKDDKE